MSTTTAPNFVASPVTPDTLADLLKQARAYLHDAPRCGQLLGMRIDEALARWSECTSFGVVYSVDCINEFENTAPWHTPKPVTFLDIPYVGAMPSDA